MIVLAVKVRVITFATPLVVVLPVSMFTVPVFISFTAWVSDCRLP